MKVMNNYKKKKQWFSYPEKEDVCIVGLIYDFQSNFDFDMTCLKFSMAGWKVVEPIKLEVKCECNI